MDGEALGTLLAAVQGPDCLKDLIPKLGARLKVYQRIKQIFAEQERVKFQSDEHTVVDLDDSSSVASSKVQTLYLHVHNHAWLVCQCICRRGHTVEVAVAKVTIMRLRD